MRFQLVIEYDGTRYGGWQLQENSLSVQQVVEEALVTVVGERVVLVSSGRTDAGVHALGMSVHFDVPQALPVSAYREGLNRLLPADIVVRHARAVPDDFHARYSAQAKWYRYQLHTGPVRPAIARHASWHVRKPLDLASMRRAAELFEGEHDFAAFTVSSCDATTSRRRIDRLHISHAPEQVAFDVVGSGFLRYMVRRLVGTLVEVGSGKRDCESLRLMLADPQRYPAGVTAPAQGLCLMRVCYPEEAPDFWENIP